MNPFTIYLSSSPSLVPFFVSVFVAELRSKGAFGKSPTGLDRPTAEMPLLGSALRGSSLLTSFSEATFLSKGFCLWSAMGPERCSRRNYRSFGRAPYSSILGRNVVVVPSPDREKEVPEASSIHIDLGFSAPYFDLPLLRSGIPSKSLTPRIQ